jgi:hypothetical protein
MGKRREAIAMMTRAIEKQETALQAEQNPTRRQLVARSLHACYGARALVYVLMRKFRQARADLERLPPDFDSSMADFYRILLAWTLAKTGAHQQSAAQAEALARQTSLSGKDLYYLALAFSASSAAARHDEKLPAAEKRRLADHYGSRAVALLYRARAAGFFTDPASVRELRTALLDWGPLQTRADFKKLLAELEADAATVKP